MGKWDVMVSSKVKGLLAFNHRKGVVRGSVPSFYLDRREHYQHLRLEAQWILALTKRRPELPVSGCELMQRNATGLNPWAGVDT